MDINVKQRGSIRRWRSRFIRDHFVCSFGQFCLWCAELRAKIESRKGVPHSADAMSKFVEWIVCDGPSSQFNFGEKVRRITIKFQLSKYIRISTRKHIWTKTIFCFFPTCHRTILRFLRCGAIEFLARKLLSLSLCRSTRGIASSRSWRLREVSKTGVRHEARFCLSHWPNGLDPLQKFSGL